MRNWSPSTGVPGMNDTATISGFTVNLDQAAQVGYITLINSTIQGANSLQTYGTFECQSSLLSPAGGVTINGALMVDPLDSMHNTMEVDCPMTINGSTTVNADAIFKIAAAVSVVNAGTFTLEDGGQLILATGGGATFVNQYTFVAGNAICSTGLSTFSNTPAGTVQVNAGATAQFQGALANSGVFNVGQGGQASITAATAMHGGGSFTGRGTAELTGNNTLDGNVTVTGNLELGNASVLTLNGTLEVQAMGGFYWLGGTLTGLGTNVTGTIQVDNAGNMFIEGLNTLTLRNCGVANYGFITWITSGNIFMGYNAQINNYYTFDISGDGSLIPLSSGTAGYGVAAFYNHKLIYKIQGATNSETTFFVPIYDSGGIVVAQGNLFFADGGIIQFLRTSANTSLQLTGGNFFLNSGGESEFNGTGGMVIMKAGTTLNIAGNQSLLIIGNFNQSGGTIYGNGTLDILYAGVFSWQGGTIAITNSVAAVKIESAGVMNIEGGGNVKAIQQGQVVNNGTINWTNDNSGGGISAGDGVVFYNAGQFNCQCDAGIGDISITVPPVFTNATSGMVTKSANTGNTFFGLLFVNYGVIHPNAGTIELIVGYRDVGSSSPESVEVRLGGGSLKFDRPVDMHGIIDGSGTLEGTITNNNLTEIESVVTMEGNIFNNGTETLGDAPGVFAYQGGGNYSQAASGRLVVPIRGTNAANMDFGQLKLDPNYGYATLAGTLEADITEGYAPPVGASFPFLTSAGRSGTFNNVIIPQGMQLNYTPGGATLVATGAVPVQIISPAVANGQFQFGFNTITNRSYTVQYEDNLASGTWTYLTNFTGNGTYWQAPPLSPLVLQRFYRVSNP